MIGSIRYCHHSLQCLHYTIVVVSWWLYPSRDSLRSSKLLLASECGNGRSVYGFAESNPFKENVKVMAH